MDSQIPALAPPPGVTSNFVDPVNHANGLVACNVVLLLVGILIVVARVVSRTVLTDWRLGWDDYVIVVSLVGTIIFAAFVIETTKWGLGKHIWDVPKSMYTPNYLWWIMASFAACPASYYFVKVSILLFYLRVFPPTKRIRYIIYFMFVYCTIYYGAAFFGIIALCNIKNKSWDITMQQNCFAYDKLTLAIGGLDLLADAMILTFPIPMVLKLKISWSQRIYLLCVFLAGIIASVACAIRVGFAAKARATSDTTMAQYYVVTLFCIEHWFALIAACMPTLGPLFRWLRPGSWKHISLTEKPTDDTALPEYRRDPENCQRVWPGLGNINNQMHHSQDDSLRGSLFSGAARKEMGLSYWNNTRTSKGDSEGGEERSSGEIDMIEMREAPPGEAPRMSR